MNYSASSIEPKKDASGQFNFGKNWDEFSKHVLTYETLANAIQSMEQLIGSMNGKSFLDVGCGSGLFSLSAFKLGAMPVVGLDINPQCIQVCHDNAQRLLPDAKIRFLELSMLDRSALEDLGCFDVVYAWGSTHHTGQMWQAIDGLVKRVAPGGTLVLAIYNKHFTSPLWKAIKYSYNKIPLVLRSPINWFFAAVIFIAKLLWTGTNPLKKERGMNFWFDVIDWLGGFPYEFASPLEVIDFVTKRGLTLSMFRCANVPTGCNEFVFVNQ